MPLQFTYSERCHYNSFEPSNMPFYTYLILLDPRAGSGIFVWTKMPLLPLHPPLTYLWAPHVSFFFFPFFPSRCRRPPPRPSTPPLLARHYPCAWWGRQWRARRASARGTPWTRCPRRARQRAGRAWTPAAPGLRSPAVATSWNARCSYAPPPPHDMRSTAMASGCSAASLPTLRKKE